jgi:3-oxoacyl-[acyl-carrier protein] reductase
MDLQLNNKTALVTGASQGIGRAIAKALAAEGVRVCVAARRRELLEELAGEITAAGGAAPAIVVVDIMQDGAPQRLAEEAKRALGGVGILINSAGGSQPAIPFDAPESDWEHGMTLNFVRVRQLTHAVLPQMVAAHWGRVINISGKSEPERLLTATSAKAAIHGWAKALSREVGRYQITVNSIAPGKIISEQILRNYAPDVRAKLAREEIPLGEFGQPEDVANLVVFLASPLARYMTGTVIPVDGGLRRYAF